MAGGSFDGAMQFDLTSRQCEDRATFAAFSDSYLAPNAHRWDCEQRLSDEIVRILAQRGYLVPSLPAELGGMAMDTMTYGLLSEQVGRGCGSVRNLTAVQGMVAHALLRWGASPHVPRWVAQIGSGERLAAFALTEPGSGSDARNLTMTARSASGGFILNGKKKWISFGQRAGIFLVFATLDGEGGAFVVERGAPGLTLAPIRDLLGLRASELAELSFGDCWVPEENLVCRGRLVFDVVVTAALDYGRYSTACGAVGLAQACLDASLEYARNRVQFGAPIQDHQLVQRLLTEMIAAIESARLLCYRAGAMRATLHPDAIRETLIAKYVASRTSVHAASDAVQIHGASGVSPDYPVERYLRDAKIQEIIEGTTQVQQVQIAELTIRKGLVPGRPARQGLVDS